LKGNKRRGKDKVKEKKRKTREKEINDTKMIRSSTGGTN
jgi:hypothetical protein